MEGAGGYNHGETVTLTATENTGYTFTGWTKNGATVSTDATYTFAASGNETYTANFSLNTYTVSVKVEPAGAGEVIGTGSYNHGETVTLTAIPHEGYAFVQWLTPTRSVLTDPTLTFTAEGNATLTALFREIPVLTVSAQPADASVLAGEKATFSAEAQGEGVKYQWQISRDGQTWTDIPGAAGASCTTGVTTLADNGCLYRCVITDSHGQSVVTDAALLSVTAPAPLPDTGDSSHAAAYLLAMAIALGGLLMLKKRGSKA